MIGVKKKFQLSKFEDLIDFIQLFINQVASTLAARRVLQGAVQSGFLQVKGVWGKEIVSKRKGYFWPGHLLGGRNMACVFIMQVTSSSFGR